MRLLADRGVTAVHIGEVRAAATRLPGSSGNSVPDVGGPGGSVPDVGEDLGVPGLEVSAGTPARMRGPLP